MTESTFVDSGGIKDIFGTVNINPTTGLPYSNTAPPVSSSISNVIQVPAEFTRPADTNAYAIADVISNSTTVPTVLTFTDIARIVGGSGTITKARLFTDNVLWTAQCRVHLFHTAPTAINDNSPYTLLYANRTNRIGFIDFPALETEGTGSDSANALWAGASDFVCATASKNIYAVLETKTAVTPTSGQKFYLELTAQVN